MPASTILFLYHYSSACFNWAPPTFWTSGSLFPVPSFTHYTSERLAHSKNLENFGEEIFENLTHVENTNETGPNILDIKSSSCCKLKRKLYPIPVREQKGIKLSIPLLVSSYITRNSSDIIHLRPLRASRVYVAKSLFMLIPCLGLFRSSLFHLLLFSISRETSVFPSLYSDSQF